VKTIPLYTKNRYILKLLFNFFTTGIEAFVALGLCQRSLQPVSSVISWCLASTAHYCWSVVLPTSSSGRWTVACSEIGATRRVAKQPGVAVIQQCWGARSCMRTRIVIDEHCTGCQHSTPFVLNCQSYAAFFFVVFRNTKRCCPHRRQTSFTQEYISLRNA
jgi:hypothetical protein